MAPACATGERVATPPGSQTVVTYPGMSALVVVVFQLTTSVTG